MNELSPRLPVAAVVLATVLAVWAIVAASRAFAFAFDAVFYLLVASIVFLELLDFLFRYGMTLHVRRRGGADATPATSIPLVPSDLTPYQKRLHLRPWAILVSVRDAEAILDDFLEALGPWREHLWVIDDGSSDQTRTRLQQAGCRCIAGGVNRKKPGAIRALLRQLPAAIETVMVLDPDCRVLDRGGGGLSDLETVIFDFQQSGMAAVCPRLVVAEDGLLARMQGLEYCIAFNIGRKSLLGFGVTSGAAIYHRADLERALERHSLSVYAEDLENSTILLADGEQVYYDARLTIETEGVRVWRRWFSQRVGWAYGLIRVYLERFQEIHRVGRRHWLAGYQYLFYLGVLGLALHPLRVVVVTFLFVGLASAVGDLFGITFQGPMEPIYVFAIYAKYTWIATLALVLAVPRGERRRLLPVVPLYFWYALLHVVPMTVGYVNYFSIRLLRRRLYQDHYQEEATLRRERLRAVERATEETS